MPRNLDVSALRSFQTVAEIGGVTRAANQLNLTQSAVSMQIKRLEEMVGQTLLDRTGRGVTLTPHGEQLLSYARRIVALNDEAMGRMTDARWEGEIRFGVPHDVVYPHIPPVLQAFARSHPRVRVSLCSSFTSGLKAQFAAGDLDLIMGTERMPQPGGETLRLSPLVWVGAPDGKAWRQRPLKLAFENGCIFRAPTQAALDAAGIGWTMAVESDSTRTVEATCSADLAVFAAMEDAIPPYLEAIPHGGALPPLPDIAITMYVAPGPNAGLAGMLADALREAYAGRAAAA
jgi:DNA-binding transcriptional LysR family regulator